MIKLRHLLLPSVALVALSAQACSSVPPRELDTPQEETGSFPPANDAGTSETSKPDDLIDEDSACATASAGTSKDPVFLEFILDGSGSMGGLTDKWGAAINAMADVFTEIEKLQDPNIGVGLILFSDSKDCTDGSGPYPGFPNPSTEDCFADVYPGYVDLAQLTALKNRMLKSSSGGGTPAGEALLGGYNVLRNFKPLPPLPADAKRVAILISDGEPNGKITAAEMLKMAIKELAANPSIPTFSVGVGEIGSGFGFDPNFMGDLAVAGGTRATPQCDPHSEKIAEMCHFQIDPSVSKGVQLKQDFVKAINRIRGLAVGCEYKIELSGGGTFNPNKVNVIWTDGAGKKHQIKKNDDNGWSYDDDANPTKVILNGQSCGDATADLESSVKVIIGCDTKL